MKSQATIASAWLRTNVAQCWDEVLLARPSSISHGQYLRTVRGDTSIPSFRYSSAATRICPQVGFSRAIRTINSRISRGRDGLPGRDFQRQKSLKPLRCQPACESTPRYTGYFEGSVKSKEAGELKVSINLSCVEKRYSGELSTPAGKFAIVGGSLDKKQSRADVRCRK